MMRRFAAVLVLVCLRAQAQVKMFPVPDEVRSNHFRVSVSEPNGKSRGHGSDVLHAATAYFVSNFETAGPATVSVTASDPHFWDKGVEVQPMRYGIRPVRHGATITFPIPGPVKLTIARPGDHFADADMLFLFANSLDRSGITAASPHVRYYGPGTHHENIDAQSGDTIYLAGGAVIFGSLNIWQVHDVRVLGEGTIIYDGPQNPHSDEGWMHKRNWHVMVMDEARNIEIDGITCITRSRSWQIQMKDSRHIGFYNIKVIGGNPNDANQDGMDWLGGGDTTVSSSFFRTSDDVFALQGNWDGYDLALMRVPGHDVTNITIEDTVASTSISNTVRVAWPQKTFNSAHFHMRDVDVIHTGFGGCKVPFAFFELWADPEGKGSHTDYRFRDIRLEDWYSLFQLRQPMPQVRDVAFEDVWAMDSAGMVPPVALGDVSGVTLKGASLQGFSGAATDLEQGAAPVVGAGGGMTGHFSYSAGMLRSKQPVGFVADAPVAAGRRFVWVFGDGSRAEGHEVRHAFPDAEGTLLDGSGRFRVLLHVVDASGGQSWGSEAVVVEHPTRTAGIGGLMGGPGYERRIHVPADGGYTFTLLTSLGATLAVDDGTPVATPKARPQVCGAPGDAVQPVRISMALKAGEHRLRVVRGAGEDNAQLSAGRPAGAPLLLWEGPGIDRQVIPPIAVVAPR